MLREMMVGERLHASSAGTTSLPVLAEANSFIHKHFWLTVHFPAIAPGTPGWTFTLTRARKLDRLRKRWERLVQLHESDREYYGWLLSGVLSMLALFAGQLVVEGVMLGPSRFGSPEQQWLASATVAAGRYVIGLTAYFGAIHVVQDYHALRRFDRTMERLDRRIAMLEAKTSLQTAPAGL